MTYLKWIFLLNILFFISPALRNQFSYAEAVKSPHPGMVRIFDDDTEIGKAFFDTSTTLITTHSVLESIEFRSGPIASYLSFLDPLTNTRIPIHQIIGIDVQYDLVRLGVENYRSPTFYPIKYFSKKRRGPLRVIVPVLKGQTTYDEVALDVLNDSFYGEHARFLVQLPVNPGVKSFFKGFSGLPVFSRERDGSLYVEGVFLSSLEEIKYGDKVNLNPQETALFVSSHKLKGLLRPELFCFTSSCITSDTLRVVQKSKNNDKNASFYIAHRLLRLVIDLDKLRLQDPDDIITRRKHMDARRASVTRAAYLFLRAAKKGHIGAKFYLKLMIDEKTIGIIEKERGTEELIACRAMLNSHSCVPFKH